MDGTAVTAAEVSDARTRLPERQGEALDLRDRGRRSYEEIAAKLDMSPSAVARLIAHARINLYDELRGTPLASVVPSPNCERGLSLIAMREDEQLEPSSEDAAWLGSHLDACERCALAVDQMNEAEAAYRAQRSADPGREPDRQTVAGAPSRATDAGDSTSTRRPRRPILATGLAALLFIGLAVVFASADRSSTPVEPAAVTTSKRDADLGKGAAALASGKGKEEDYKAKPSNGGAGSVASTNAGQAAVAETPSTPVAAPIQGNGGGESGSSGSGGGHPAAETAVEPTQQTAASKPGSKPKPRPTRPSSPAPSSTASAPPSAPESATPTEEPVDEPGHRGEHGHSGEPPGKSR